MKRKATLTKILALGLIFVLLGAGNALGSALTPPPAEGEKEAESVKMDKALASSIEEEKEKEKKKEEKEKKEEEKIKKEEDTDPDPGEWYDSGWPYRRAVDVSNPCGEETTDYQVQITLDSTFDFGHALPDGSDLRVTDSDGLTIIPYWVEAWDAAGQTASIWVKVPVLPSTIYLYYGNPTASPAGDGSSTFIFFDSFEDFNAEGMNAPTPLNTPTYDGSGQVVHPDLIYVPGGWNGYEYWMAMTPYPNGNPGPENPSVITSDDGITWEVPTGLTNPLVSGGSNADTDFLIVNDVMVLYYINADAVNSSVYRMTSTDGISWTAPQAVITMPRYLLGPTVLYEGGTYYMWYVRNGGCSDSSSSMYMRTSADGISWNAEQSVNISHPGHVMWHPDVLKDGDTYHMLVASYPVGSDCGHTSLYYAESSDRVNWTLNTTPVLAPSSSGWDSAEIYRSTFLVDGTYFRIWYSARNASSQWHVGYTEGELAEFVGGHQPLWDEIIGNVSATTDHPRSGDYGLREVGGSTYPQVLKDIGGRFSFNAWLYDDMSTASNYLAIQRIRDQERFMGVGLWVGQSPTHYAYHNAGPGWHYSTSGMARTPGWHKLSMNVNENDCDLLIDDTLVATLDELDEANIAHISLEGYQGGVGYFDDAYVRAYCGADAVAAVGDEEQHEEQTGSITVFKYNDLNGDGVHDVGEPGLEGWDFTANSETKPTESDGYVTFDGLIAGQQYQVCETLKPGWTNSTPLCQTVTATAGGGTPGPDPVILTTPADNSYEIDFQGVSNGGLTWEYQVTTQPGSQDLSHWVLGLCMPESNVTGSTPPYDDFNTDPTTQVTGAKWESEGGTFSITFDTVYPIGTTEVGVKSGSGGGGGGGDQSDKVATGEIAGPNCNGSSVEPVKFGNFYALNPGIDIQKTVYAGHDGGASCPGSELVVGQNGDAVTYCFVVTNTGDTYLSNIQVSDPDLGTPVGTIAGPLAPSGSSTLFLESTINGDLTNTATATGNPTDDQGNDLPGVDDVSDTDTAEVGEKPPPTFLLGDTVWYDSDADGIYDPGESGVAGVDVDLYDNGTCSGQSIASATTDIDGHYVFEVLADTYCLQFSNLPAGFAVSPQNVGDDDTIDSDANPASIQITNINLTANDFDEDMGIFLLHPGVIIVEKQTELAVADPSFEFSANYYTSNFTLVDDGTNNSGPLTPRTYSVSEVNIPADWTLDSIICVTNDTANPAPVVSKPGVTIDLHPDEIVTCTFNNVGPGSITVIKSAEPSDGTDFDFTLTRPDNSTVNVTLDDDTDPVRTDNFTVSQLGAGDYDITEALPNGWILDSASCTGGTDSGSLDGETLTVALAQGEDIICTFTNGRIPEIRVIKDLVPSDDSGRFNLQIDSIDEMTDVGHAGDTGFVQVSVGDHSVGETAVTGTILGDYDSSISCDNDDSGSGTSLGGITVAYGDQVTCTITNERKPPETGSLSVLKMVTPSNSSQTFEICITGPSHQVPNCMTFDHMFGVTWVNLIPGPYTVLETPPGPGWIVSYDPDSSVTVVAGQTANVTVYNTHRPPEPGDITAHKFYDDNGDGQQAASGDEPSLDDWTMSLYVGHGCDGELIMDDETDASGNVLFTPVKPGDYSVMETLKTGWQNTTPTCQNVTLPPGGAETVNFGNQEIPEICIDLVKEGPPTAEPGDTITYDFVVHNCGQVKLAGGAQVYDHLFGDDPIWDGDLEPGESQPFSSMEYTLPEKNCDDFTNEAYAIGHPLGYSTTVEAIASWTVDVICEPDECEPGTFDFSGRDRLSGTEGNIKTYTVNGVNVKVTGWSRDKTTGEYAPAYVGAYSGGLGVTDESDGNGSSHRHTVDNNGMDNYLLFEFDQPVVPYQLYLGYVKTDTDASLWFGQGPSGAELDDDLLDGLNTEDNDGSGSVRWADFNTGNQSGNILVVAAKLGDSDDHFKVRELAFKCPTCADADNDGVCDDVDNCVDTYNTNQKDADQDGIGDACDDTLPTFSARFPRGEVHGYDWPLGADVTIAIDETNDGTEDYSDTRTVVVAPWDTSMTMTFVVFPLESFTLEPGQFISMTDGVSTKEHTVRDITITAFDLASKTVTGEAAPGTDVWVDYCDDMDCYEGDVVTADGSGNWTTTFADIEAGDSINANQSDPDWDHTAYEWRVPTPWLEAYPDYDWVDGFDWPFGTDVSLNINGTDFGSQLVVNSTSWDPNISYVEFDLNGLHTLIPDDIVTLSGGGVTKIHSVTDLTVTGVDAGLNTISGNTTAPFVVDVWPHADYGSLVTVSGGGAWVADLTPYDILPGDDGAAVQSDDDGDGTWVDWQAAP